MNKIPVWKTIQFAYAFTFGEIGTIIGLIWVPMVGIGVLQFLSHVLAVARDMEGGSSAAAGGAGLLNLLFFFTTLLLYAIVYVAITRQALGERQGSVSVHFAFGRPEWRMLSARLLFAVLLTLIAIAFFATVELASQFLPAPGSPVTVMCLSLYVLAGLCAMIYVAIRLFFLLSAVVVAEEKVDLRRGWTLAAGNFWRALLVMAAVGAPPLIVEGIVLRLIGGPGLFAPVPLGGDVWAAIADRFNALDAHTPALIGLTLIVAPFANGLGLSATAGAYRALVPARGRQS